MASGQDQINIAVIGGGIVGVVLAVGLHAQPGVNVKVYERSRGFREIGAGIAFTACARRCMSLIDPAVTKAFQSCGAMGLKSADPSDPNDYLSWVDGYNQRRPHEPDYETPLFKIDAGYNGFAGTRRDMFLEALVKALPDDVVECRKQLERIEEQGLEDEITLKFPDGTSAKADAVIGCDGLKSRVKEYLLGEGNPASYVSYTNVVAYRGLVTMDNTIKAIGEAKAKYFTMHIGPGVHMLHYPVANGTMVNVVAFVADAEDWEDNKNLVKPALRSDVEKRLADWNPSIRALISHFPENIDKWALFDSFENPAPFYNRGKICLAGDAAHASSPHHGAGAGMGVEDALCLSALMTEACLSLRKKAATKGQALSTVFAAYDAVRRKRTQWFVNSSRRVCDLYQTSDWGSPDKWVKADTCWEEIKDRSHKIWHYNPDSMVEEAIKYYLNKLELPPQASEKPTNSISTDRVVPNGFKPAEVTNGVTHHNKNSNFKISEGTTINAKLNGLMDSASEVSSSTWKILEHSAVKLGEFNNPSQEKPLPLTNGDHKHSDFAVEIRQNGTILDDAIHGRPLVTGPDSEMLVSH